jgi:PAS domain-containing protein
MPLIDAARRWAPVVERLKMRLARKMALIPPNLDEAVDEALSTCESLLRDLAASQMENADLSRRLKDLIHEWAYLFEQMPIACVATDRHGTVIQSNPAAAELINMSARHLENRLLAHFIQDREAFSETLKQFDANIGHVGASFVIRPRERAPLMIDAIAVPRTPADPSVWLWFLIPHHAGLPTRSGGGRRRMIGEDAAS